jgi:hypothetical protein
MECTPDGEGKGRRFARGLVVAGAAAAVAALYQASSVQLQYSNLPPAVRAIALGSVSLVFLLTLGLIVMAPASPAGARPAAWWPRLVAAAVGAGVASTLLVYPDLFVRGGKHYHPSGILGDLAMRVALMGGLAWLSKAAVSGIGQRLKAVRFHRYALIVAGCAMFVRRAMWSSRVSAPVAPASCTPKAERTKLHGMNPLSPLSNRHKATN